VACEEKKPQATTPPADAGKPKPAWAPDFGDLQLPPAQGSPTASAEPTEPPPTEPGATDAGKPAASATASNTANKPPPGTKPGPEAKVSLINPGGEPKKKLRYRFKAGQKEKMTMDIASSAEGGQQLPGIRVTFAVLQKAVTKDGDAEVEAKLTGGEALPGQQMPPQMQQAVQREIAGLAGFQATIVVSPRGTVNNANLSIGKRVSSPVAQAWLQQLVGVMHSFTAPLPEEAVGKGAKWERSMKLGPNEGNVAQKETFTLVDLNGDVGTVEIVSSQTQPGSNQTVQEGPGGVLVKLISSTSSGKGKTIFDLSRVVPKWELEGTNEVDLALVNPETKQEDKQKKVLKSVTKVEGVLEK
jgi:hypothetical protein